MIGLSWWRWGNGRIWRFYVVFDVENSKYGFDGFVNIIKTKEMVNLKIWKIIYWSMIG